jgi:hypothetical protein
MLRVGELDLGAAAGRNGGEPLVAREGDERPRLGRAELLRQPADARLDAVEEGHADALQVDREPVAERLQDGFLARPAGEEGVGTRALQLGALVVGERDPGDAGLDVAVEPLNVDADRRGRDAEQEPRACAREAEVELGRGLGEPRLAVRARVELAPRVEDELARRGADERREREPDERAAGCEARRVGRAAEAADPLALLAGEDVERAPELLRTLGCARDEDPGQGLSRNGG